MRLKDAPIQRKIMSVILLTCFNALILMGSAYVFLEYKTYRLSLKSNVETLADVIAYNSSASLAFDSPEDATEILNALKAENHIVKACLYDSKGKLFARYSINPSDTIYPLKPAFPGFDFSDGFFQGYKQIVQSNKLLGTLFIKSDLSSMKNQIAHFTVIGIFLLLGALFFAYILSKILQRNISDPILYLQETAKAISERRDYSVRAVKFGKDEIGSLTDAFNTMLDRIENQNHEILLFNKNLEKKVEERTSDLQQQKEFIEAIINTSVDLIAVFDRDLRYIMLNKTADSIYNVQSKDLIGKKIMDVFPETVSSGLVANIEKALKGEYIHDLVYRSKVVNRYFENYYIPLRDSSNTIYGVLTIGHDISNVMEANAKLEAVNAELLKSNRDLEQFAYIASHDLQEPLRKIRTFSQLLGESFHDTEKLKSYHTKISLAAERMQELIRDVLNFSRLSKDEEAFLPVDLNVVVENIRNDFELVFREKDASLQVNRLPTIRAIPLQMSQLFSNLISNSLKYNDKKPVITINAEPLPKSEIKKYPILNPTLDYIKITFNDNGIGFEPKYKDLIFNIFQRLHGKQEYSGTGIGLGICKKIVENHNGLIFADSVPEVGSTFSVILPVSLTPDFQPA